MSYQVPPQEPPKTSASEDKMMLILTHLLGIVTSFLGPLVLMLVSNSPVVKEHSREALNFQLTLLIGYVAAFILTFVLIGFFLFMALPVVNIVFCVVAAVKANEGVLWRYPATIRFV